MPGQRKHQRENFQPVIFPKVVAGLRAVAAEVVIRLPTGRVPQEQAHLLATEPVATGPVVLERVEWEQAVSVSQVWEVQQGLRR